MLGTSVAALFMAGYIPGILWGLACMAVIFYFAKKKGYRSTKKYSNSEKVKVFFQAIPCLLMIEMCIRDRFYRMDAQMHSIWFAAVRRQKLWEMLQAQQLHYTRFRMLDFITETDFMRIIGEHEDLFSMIVDKNEKGLEEALKEHLYYRMKRMRRSIEVDYKDYFEEENEEGRFVI